MANAGSYIQYADFSDLIDRLEAVYSTHDLSWDWDASVAPSSISPLSQDIKRLYNLFVNAYTEEHLASCIKWTIESGELEVGATMKASTINNAAASLIDMELQTHYSKVVNTAGTTHTQTENTASTTYTRTTNTASTTYTNTAYTKSCTQNTMRNSSRSGNGQCTCHTVYSSDNSKTTNTAGTSYSRSSYTAGTTNTQTSHTAGTTYTFA